MSLLLDIFASAIGRGPRYNTAHQQVRDLLRFEDETYWETRSGILELYYTLPWLDYGSTRENDEWTGRLLNQAPGSSKFDQWYNARHPDGKKKRERREASKAFNLNINDLTTVEEFESLVTRAGNGPQIMYNYYENGTWPGPRLAVMIVDKLGDSKEYGTDLSNVRYGFKAKLTEWDFRKAEYQGIEFTHLYIDGKSVPMTDKTMAAANDYAARLTAMIFRDDGQIYEPDCAMEQTLGKFGADVFQTSVWQARRERQTAPRPR